MSVKSKNKEALKEWREWSKKIFESTTLDPLETEETKQARIKKAKRDYRFFVKTYFPHYASSDCADFQVSSANIVKKQKNVRLIRKWARGHAKSVNTVVLETMWLMIQEDKTFHFMLLINKNLDGATTLLGDLQAEFEQNQLYLNDFGQKMSYGNWQDGAFATTCNRFFKALGRGQSPRGLRYKQYRPDRIIFDDLDDDELSRNPARLKKVVDWVIEAVIGAMDMGRGDVIFAGNMISKNSVISEMSKNKRYIVHQVNALDKNGKPSWWQKNSLEDIQLAIEEMGYRRSQKELFNNPITEGAIFKEAWLTYVKTHNLKKYDRLIAYCDPSFKNTATADYKAVMLVGATGRNIHILDAFVRKCSVGELVRWFYNLHEDLKGSVICEYYMEANFLQDLIMDEFEQEGEQRGYQLPIRPDKRKKPDKHARIEAISPLFERGLIHINEKKKEHPDMLTFIEQLLAFEKGSRSHDDAPDALEGGVFMLSSSFRSSKSSYRMEARQTRKF